MGDTQFTNSSNSTPVGRCYQSCFLLLVNVLLLIPGVVVWKKVSISRSIVNSSFLLFSLTPQKWIVGIKFFLRVAAFPFLLVKV